MGFNRVFKNTCTAGEAVAALKAEFGDRLIAALAVQRRPDLVSPACQFFHLDSAFRSIINGERSLVMPKIGFASISMTGSPWLDALRSAVEHRFDAFELCVLYPDSPPDMAAGIISLVNDIVETNGIELCLHAPFFEHNIAALCPGIREASLGSIMKTIDLAEKLRVKTMVVHNGGYAPPGPPGTSRFNDDRLRKHWDHNIASLKELVDYATKKGVVLCLENIGFDPFSVDGTFGDMAEIRENVGSALQFTLDMGHAQSPGRCPQGH